MSLKSFHLVIITLAWVMTFTFAGWCFFAPEASDSSGYTVAGAVAVALGLTLIAYEVNFIIKMKQLPGD